MTKEMKYRAYTLHNYKELPQIKHLSPQDIEAIEVVGRVLPFKANNYVVEQLIDWNNIPNDPIFTLTFPRKEMLSEEHYNQVLSMLEDDPKDPAYKETIDTIRRTLNPNPAGQEHNVPTLEGESLDGMQHKYRETVLFFPSQGQTCHAYCTFCFRWPQFSGMSDLKFAMKEADLLHEYLRQHKEVTDVLFTGGDPLTTTSRVLSTYIEDRKSTRLNSSH